MALGSSLLQTAGRVLTAPIFITGGYSALTSPGGRVAAAAPTLDAIREYLPVLPEDDELLVRANGGLQLLAGTTMALGYQATPLRARPRRISGADHAGRSRLLGHGRRRRCRTQDPLLEERRSAGRTPPRRGRSDNQAGGHEGSTEGRSKSGEAGPEESPEAGLIFAQKRLCSRYGQGTSHRGHPERLHRGRGARRQRR